MKNFREHAELVSILSQRGLDVGDPSEAVTHLRRHGYHRLGGYRYPFRELLPEAERDVPARTFRRDEYEPGSRLTDVLSLSDFDMKLRRVVLDGVLEFEVRLREAVTHVLARRDVLAHCQIYNLNEFACNEPTGDDGVTKFDAWQQTVVKAVRSARDEDYIAHHVMREGGLDVPVWAALDLVSFGSLPYLLDLCLPEDRRTISSAFGVTHDGRFVAWVRAIADLRNDCAHNVRLFNRRLKRAVAVNSSAGAGSLLAHLYKADVDRRKLYSVAAVLAYLLRSHEAGTNWQMAFKTQVRKLPEIVLPGHPLPLISPVASMGFVEGWENLALWNRD